MAACAHAGLESIGRVESAGKEKREQAGVRVGGVGSGSRSCGHYREGGGHGVCLHPLPASPSVSIK